MNENYNYLIQNSGQLKTDSTTHHTTSHPSTTHHATTSHPGSTAVDVVLNSVHT